MRSRKKFLFRIRAPKPTPSCWVAFLAWQIEPFKSVTWAHTLRTTNVTYEQTLQRTRSSKLAITPSMCFYASIHFLLPAWQPNSLSSCRDVTCSCTDTHTNWLADSRLALGPNEGPWNRLTWWNFVVCFNCLARKFITSNISSNTEQQETELAKFASMFTSLDWLSFATWLMIVAIGNSQVHSLDS